MHFKSILTFCILICLSSLVTGQTADDNIFQWRLAGDTRDSLVIFRQNGHKIMMTWPYRKNIHKHIAWEELLDAFQSDLSKVISDIPEYEFYEINYWKNNKLIVDEVTGREIYTVNADQGIDNLKTNMCLLRNNKVQLSIEFTDKSELLHPSLKQELASAISSIKKVARSSPERHYYSAITKSKIPIPKRKTEVFFPAGFRAGFVLDQPHIDVRAGVGLKIGQQDFVSLKWNLMTSFNSISQSTDYDHFLSVTFGNLGHGFRIEWGIKVIDGDTSAFRDLLLRSHAGYKTRSGLIFGVDYYLRDRGEDDALSRIVFGAHIGMGF